MFLPDRNKRRTNIGLDQHHSSLKSSEWVNGTLIDLLPGVKHNLPIEPRLAGIERVATSSTPISVAERDAGCIHKADGVESVETGVISIVNRAGAAADALPCIEGITPGERPFGGANEGEVRIRSAEPLVELYIADNGCPYISTLQKF
ncbi:hypothetical protein PC9H_006280 [Pleurotus ostreatus]|uniref:Uncharacterized protein n=1 Tax=Pleurotus ostreatus TaxID=5322 RepID=A0A8H6ZXN3_PLEOS|nr:uncharacterized protein PC9H_006280 [Pleurotus ostreatus]KAF7430572.1 hypothetical protein PC9H_006280 [Pleurotus ostreatus]KAJ8694865.1 hypothetical protein PTI98_007504 [Pleurotus ostreatus]